MSRCKFALFLPVCTFVSALAPVGRAADIPPGCSHKYLQASRKNPDVAPYTIRGKYCDGTVALLNSGELVVVSYTVGPIQFSAAQAELTVFSMSRSATPIHLLGVDKREGGSYRLDGMIGPEGLTISLPPAIHLKKIDQNSLGLLGWREDQLQPIYVPVAVNKTAEHASSLLTFRTPVAIVQGDYQICDAAERCGPQATFIKSQPGGSLISLNLPSNLSGGTHTIKLTIEGPGDALFGQTILIEAAK